MNIPKQKVAFKLMSHIISNFSDLSRNIKSYLKDSGHSQQRIKDSEYPKLHNQKLKIKKIKLKVL